MENKSKPEKRENKEKVGIVPSSQLSGSDADSAYPEDVSFKEQENQAHKSDADEDELLGDSSA